MGSLDSVIGKGDSEAKGSLQGNFQLNAKAIALLLSVVIQIFGFVYAIGKFEGRMDSLTLTVEEMQKDIREIRQEILGSKK